MTSPEALQVLLVEKDRGEQWVVTEALRSRGYTVTTCEDVASALDLYDPARFPLAVLDWDLPGPGGEELCRRVRTHPQGDRTVLLVVTERDGAADLEKVVEAGADDYLTRPVDLELLQVRLGLAERNIETRKERRQAEEELALATQELRTLLQSLGDVFFSVDLEGNRLIHVSPGVEEVLGISARRLEEEEERWPELLAGHDVGELRRRLKGVEEDGSLVLDYRLEAADGTSRWVEASLRPTRSPDGTVRRLDGVISDVTENRKHQEELAARNRELLTLYRISEVTLSAPSLESGFAEILDVICRATGFPIASIERELPDRPELAVVASRGLPPEYVEGRATIPRDGTASGEAFRTGKVQVVEDAGREPGYFHPLVREMGLKTVLAFPIQVEGETVSVLSLAHTQALPPDERLLHWGTSLANYLATFTARVRALEALRQSEAQYRALVGELQRANRELEAFAYTVSHDLLTPLRTMQGFSHTLLNRFGSEMDPEAQGYIRRILASGDQAEHLIRDLLNYSRLSLEEIELEPVSLEEVISHAITHLDAGLTESGAHLEVQETLPRVLGHATTLVQIMTNLLSNAVKFTRDNESPRIRIRHETRGARVRVWVEDEGPGIPEGQQERIFRAFERLQQVREVPGTGIGLAIVRRAVERLQGEVGLESTPGEGSRFWIELPLA